jgi:beta-phosphoglucomutase-like phosphatase (HAD superfamily)
VSDTGVIVTLSPRDYDAVLFDLDGVLTRTASVHAEAWKKLFDAFLAGRAAEMGELGPRTVHGRSTIASGPQASAARR